MKKNRFSLKKTFCFFLAIAALLLAGCGEGKGAKISLDVPDLRNDAGAFVFPDSKWGDTAEEVSEKLGIDLAKTEPIRAGITDYYYPDARVSFAGKETSPAFEFINGKLMSVTLEASFSSGEEAQGFFDQFVEKALAEFGPSDEEVNQKYEKDTSEFRIWYGAGENDTTKMNIVRLEEGENTMVVFMVFDLAVAG